MNYELNRCSTIRQISPPQRFTWRSKPTTESDQTQEAFRIAAVESWRHAPLTHTASRDSSGATPPASERVGEESSRHDGHANDQDDDPGNYKHDAEGQGKSHNDQRQAEGHRQRMLDEM
jgi:hypothetical protein